MCGIYVGVVLVIVGSVVSWGVYFVWYDGARARYVDAFGRERNGVLLVGVNMMVVMEVGVVMMVLMNLIWVVKMWL